MHAIAARIAALIGKSIKLLDMRQINPDLLAHPLPKTDFHCPMPVGHERAKRQTRGRVGSSHKAALKPVIIDPQDGGRQINQDFRC